MDGTLDEGPMSGGEVEGGVTELLEGRATWEHKLCTASSSGISSTVPMVKSPADLTIAGGEVGEGKESTGGDLPESRGITRTTGDKGCGTFLFEMAPKGRSETTI